MNEQPNTPSKRPSTDMASNLPNSNAPTKLLTRRSLARASLGAPVLMTLASKPAFGLQCLSNMLSGNLSDPNRGNICNGGWSPGGWGNPGGTIHSYSTTGAWAKAGANYGSLKASETMLNKESSYNDDGTKFSATGFTAPSDWGDITIRKVLIDKNGSNQFHFAAAWLNANLSKNDPSFVYFLTPTQLAGLGDGSIPLPPPYFAMGIVKGLAKFIDDNYHI